MLDEQPHIFCDAVAMGYGSLVYQCIKGGNGAIHVTILCAQSHVIPLNSSQTSHHNSIPHLELIAAEKAVEICLFIERATHKKFPRTIIWSDCECILKQIANMTTRFKAYFEIVC